MSVHLYPVASRDIVESKRGPWRWRPSPVAFLRHLAGRACCWIPAPELGLNLTALPDALDAAAEEGAKWLLHPMMSRLTLEESHDSRREARDFQFAVWLAAHNVLPPQYIYAPNSIWVWTSGGSFRVKNGRYDLAGLGATVSKAVAPSAVALDVWCHTLGIPLRGSWAAIKMSNERHIRLERDLVLFLRAWALLEELLPDCADWIAAATSVVIPLYSKDRQQFRSGSAADLPGLIQMDLGSELQILEALVHETAHRHLYLAEAASPLVDPMHKACYRSPLRPDPRPLRGLLMAWHALSYIALFYREATECALLGSTGTQDLHRICTLLDDAEETVMNCQGALTTAGLDFFNYTSAVTRHVRN